MSFASLVFNMMCKKSDAKRDAGLTIPDDVKYIRDVRYGRNRKYHTLDICWPRSFDSEKLPVIISIHGGGYVYGSKEVYQFYVASLAERGFIVINFNYRLAPKYTFPAPLEDLNQVIKWMMAKRDGYPFDLENVFLVGDSAGAQIASQYGVIYSNKEYRKIMGFRKPKIKIRALGLCCGTYDLYKNAYEESGNALIADYLTKYPQQFGEKLNVLKYITKDFPPSYIFSAGGDFLLEECKPMANLLTENGVKCEYKIYGDKNTYHVFHVNVRDEVGQKANDDQMDFFKKFIDAE